MLLLKIEGVSAYKPVKWKFKDLTALKEGQHYISFGGGRHPDNPEYGSIILSAKVVEGSFDDINQVYFLDKDGFQGKLLHWKKKFFGGYRIEIELNIVFAHGLMYCLNHIIRSGQLIIGLSEQEKTALNELNVQRQLLALLAGHLLPSRKQEILQFARPAYLCIPNEGNDESRSHFLGLPKHRISELTNDEGQTLFHLATMQFADFQGIDDLNDLDKNVSFYLRTRDTDIAWPERKKDYKVIYHGAESRYSDNPDTETAINFDTKKLLDLPGYDHSLLRMHGFTKQEREKYNQLSTVFMTLVKGDPDSTSINKLFGYPDSVQNCVTYEAERVFNQRPYSDEIYADAVNWVLLLQVSPYCKWFDFFDYFGDGTIYYMIRKEDLKNGNFDNCQLIIQHT